MTFFKYFTPITYWLLVLMWSFIFLFYINRLRSKTLNGRLLFILLTILAIDSFRTLFESAYFGFWYTSLVGFLPKTVYTFLIRPEIVFIPKSLNVIAAIAVIVILIYRWIPQEEHEKKYLNDLVDKQTEKLSKSNKMLNNEIAERKLIEQDLRESEKYLDNIISNIGDPVFVKDNQSRLLLVNDAFCKLFDLTRDSIIGKTLAEEVLLDEQESFLKIDNQVLTTGQENITEESLTVRGGQTQTISTRKTRFVDNNGKKYLVGVIRDLTDRKNTEKALIEKTEFLDKVIESAALSTWISDEKGTVIRTNPACLDLFGATEEEVIGKYNLFQDIVIEKNGFMPDIRKVFEKGKSVNIVIDYDFASVDHVAVKKATHKTINSIFTPIKDASGKVTNVIVQTIDLTDIKKMEQELIQSSKMESIGKLAGGIAHEFNNILSIIIGNNELVMQELPEWNLARESTEEIRIAGMRARDVVKQLLTFSRQDSAVKKVINFRSVVQESMKLIRSSTPTNIEIQQTFSDDVYPVLGNETQINQLLINLCSNAVDAMPTAGAVMAVELLNEIVDENQARHHPGLKPGQYVKLKVRDNGIGMDKTTIDRIFEPYYTTKEIGKGSGIGLAVVHGIVKRHGGLIIADSQPGQGSVFILFFPVHEGPLEDKQDEDFELPTGDECILYVDDEPAIAKLGKRHLEHLGYTAESTTDPLEALEMVKTDKDKFDLVISDMAMPNMTGDQLITEILKIRPDMPAIICTGYSAKVSEKDVAKIGVSSFAMKPLDKAELAKEVRKVLDNKKNI